MSGGVGGFISRSGNLYLGSYDPVNHTWDHRFGRWFGKGFWEGFVGGAFGAANFNEDAWESIAEYDAGRSLMTNLTFGAIPETGNTLFNFGWTAIWNRIIPRWR